MTAGTTACPAIIASLAASSGCAAAPSPPSVSVCVCTYKRPDLLARLLTALANQLWMPPRTFEIVVVDNDSARSGEDTVRRFQRRSDIHISYECEPRQNISLARNLAVRQASGRFIAFLDDDERPAPDWLIQIYQAAVRHHADGVLGPVLPDFPSGAPGWLQRGDFFDRRRLPTGSAITAADARTGNVLLRRAVFSDTGDWFDPVFGRTGGEDADFFRRQRERGRRFVWCDEAIAFETVPPQRWSAAFHVRKYFRIGTTRGRLARSAGGAGQAAGRNLLRLVTLLLVFPLSLLLGKHRWMQVLTRLAYSSAFLLAIASVTESRYRD